MDNESRYKTEVDLAQENFSQGLIVEMVGAAHRVLDVGCAAGDTAEALSRLGCTVSGVDIEDVVPADRRALFDRLEVADIEQRPLSTMFDETGYDAVVFGDVLEHLLDPAAALADAITLLRPGGRIVMSIPNVTHASVRLALAQGRWRYTRTGILDTTHVRFYTQESACRLLEDAGLVIEDLRGTIADPFDTEVEFDATRLPDGLVDWIRHQPDAMCYQFVAAARLAEPGEEVVRPVLRPGAPPSAVRREDDYHHQALAERRRSHQQLIGRDHVIGLEAQTAAAGVRQAKAEDKEARLDLRARRLRAQLDGLIAAIDDQPGWRTTKALRELVDEARPPRRRRDS